MSLILISFDKSNFHNLSYDVVPFMAREYVVSINLKK